MLGLRTFVLYSRHGPTKNWGIPPFNYGRMDIVCNSVIAAFHVSKNIRRNVEFYVVLNGPPDPPRILYLRGDSLRRLPVDEYNMALFLKEQQTIKKSFNALIRELSKRPIYVLEERGEDIREVKIEKNPVFVLGDNIGLPKNEEKFVLRYAKGKISLGRVPYFTATAISIINYELDRRDFPLRKKSKLPENENSTSKLGMNSLQILAY